MDLALLKDRAAPGEAGSRSVTIRLAGAADAVVPVPSACSRPGRRLRRRGGERVELGIGRRRRRSDRRRVGGSDHRSRVDRPAQGVRRVVELAGHRVDRQHPAPGVPAPVRARVVQHLARGVRARVRGVGRHPRIYGVAGPIPLQHHRHRTKGSRLGRAQQLSGRDVGDAVVERVRIDPGIAGVRIQDELLPGTAGTVRVRTCAGDRVPAAVGVGVVVGHAVHGDGVEIVGGAGCDPGPCLTRERRPWCDDHGSDLEWIAVACGQDVAVRIDQPDPWIRGRPVEEAGVDRRVGQAAAAVVDEIARYRVPQRLARPIAKLDAQRPGRAWGGLAGPGEPADEVAVRQPARHAVGLAVVAFRVRIAIRERQHPGGMLHSTPGETGPDRPTDDRPLGMRERPCGHGGFARPWRRGALQPREQDAGTGE